MRVCEIQDKNSLEPSKNPSLNVMQGQKRHLERG